MRCAPTARMLADCFLIMAVLLTTALPASAKILKTKHPVQPGRELELIMGSGFEYETDSEQSEYGFPFLLEYGFTRALKLTVEPSYFSIHIKKGGSVSGLGDLETTLNYEFLRERRYRPGLAVVGVVKWPTATHAEIGTGRADYSLGAIVSKEFVRFDLDFNALYTFVGSPPGVNLQNALEVSLAGEWHLNPVFDLESEVLTSNSGGFRGRPGTIAGVGGRGGNQGGREIEGTLGLAENLNEFLKLEEGMILKSGGSWQAVVAWEWNFGGGN